MALAARLGRARGAAGLLAAVLVAVWAETTPAQATDPLPSWNDGPSKQALVAFAARTTTEGSPAFVAPAQRIATFDHDGTLWVEHPLYVQAMFALDRVKALAPEHPEWKSDASFNAVLADDREMLEWTGAGEGARLMMLVLHDDAEREYAYGPANGLPDTQIGAFSPSLLDEAKTRGWVVISMKRDWKRIFPPAVGTR